jgi:uncharacterized coiled-coil protein SlyX
MKELSFAEKNSFVIKYTNGKYFFQDLLLFQEYFPARNRLNNELARANPFTYNRLDGQMLYELLSVVSTNEILKNRGEAPKKEVIKNINQTKKIIKQMNLNPSDFPTEFLEALTGKTLDSFETAVNDFVKAKSNENPNPEDQEQRGSRLDDLNKRIEALEANNELAQDDIETLRGELEDKDSSIDELQAKVEALEEKAIKKKEANATSSPG